MEKLFSLDEIINENGKSIYRFSNNSGKTELEKFKNSSDFSDVYSEYTIGKYICLVFFNGSSHKEHSGYFLMVFDSDSGKLVEDTFPAIKLWGTSRECVKEVLGDLNLVQ